jgi:hypothetical protein
MRVRTDLDPSFHLLWIRILLFITDMRICDQWPTDSLGFDLEPSRIQCERLRPPRLHFELLKLLNFDFNADPDPTFHSNVDPNPAFQTNAVRDPRPCKIYTVVTVQMLRCM